MPIVQVQGTSLEYYLIAFDKDGNEREEDDGTFLSNEILEVLSTQPITDVFFISHGWLADVPAAKAQYQKWIAAMANNRDDIDAIKQARPGFNPLLIGFHWPSKPFGNEDLNAQIPSFDVGRDSQLEELIEDYARQVSDTEATKEALRVIFSACMEYDTPPPSLPPEVFDAYQVLIEEASLSNQGEDSEEWKQSEGLNFDPESIYQASLEEDADVIFGISDRIVSARDKFLEVLRYLSFWTMKERARQIGQTSGFKLLKEMQLVTDYGVKFHLIGHSFGTIVVSATVAGTKGDKYLPRPVNSLSLIQGAVSLWSYTQEIPSRNNLAGYFHPIIADAKVAGPIITTQSDKDTAIKNAYPIGATIGLALGQNIDFKSSQYPEVGGIGTYGIQGEDLHIINMPMLTVEEPYDFEHGLIYNLESSEYISVENVDRFSGAHNAIDKPEVAHAVWSAVLSS